MKKLLKKDGWELAGYTAVDSGQVMVCDPCYIDSEWEEERFDMKNNPKSKFSYAAACNQTLSPKSFGQLKFKAGHPGVAVVCSSGTGDGMYPVYVRTATVPSFGKRIVEVRIIFEEDV